MLSCLWPSFASGLRKVLPKNLYVAHSWSSKRYVEDVVDHDGEARKPQSSRVIGAVGPNSVNRQVGKWMLPEAHAEGLP